MVVMGYNQQDSIGYAIDSALLQDYDGSMTIVLSDDCSSDGTFDVMRKKAEAYRGGFHLILNRNEANLGYAGNLLKAIRLADSDLVCKLDGDDYAFADRVTLLVKAFELSADVTLAAGMVQKCLCLPGKPLPNFARLPRSGTGEIHLWDDDDLAIPSLGCVAMWRRSALVDLGEEFAQYRGISEDAVIAVLCRMQGKIGFVERELLCYISNGKNVSNINPRSVASSFSLYRKSLLQWNEMMERGAEGRRHVNEWVRHYEQTHPDMPREYREWTQKYLHYWDLRYKEQLAYCAYHHRSFAFNVIHWLLHRDAPLSRLCPISVKCIIRWLGAKLGAS